MISTNYCVSSQQRALDIFHSGIFRVDHISFAIVMKTIRVYNLHRLEIVNHLKVDPLSNLIISCIVATSFFLSIRIGK